MCPYDECVDYLSITFGMAGLTFGGLEAVNGAGVTIAGALSLQPEVAIPGFLVMVNGVATAYDGVSAIQTAQDGKGRESTYTEAAGDCCGIWRECGRAVVIRLHIEQLPSGHTRTAATRSY